MERALSQLIPPTILAQIKPNSPPVGKSDGFALWVRMLFSCLVDADFLDTEAFMDEGKAAQRAEYPTIQELLRRFTSHMKENFSGATPTRVNGIRAEVLRQCREKANDTPGMFSLTVPTGGGKTLSSLAFALQHAAKHGKHRVIYVIPYTSITEQTAKIFRGIFPDAVVEHHSNLDPDKETVKSRLAAENWDAPIIVTTNVQFFESLFAARTSRCRKLHHIVNSVVVLDEAQLLPPEFLQPILMAMNLLAQHYGVTFVLSTATQPALNSRSGFGWTFKGLDGVHEIVSDRDSLYRDLERVSYDVMTPSAARAVFEAILWKPAIRWQVSKIEVLQPIKWINLRRNEVGCVASTRNIETAMRAGAGQLGIFVEDERQQRAGLFLRDVKYRIHAHFELRDPSFHRPNYPHLSKRKISYDESHLENESNAAVKFMSMFERRAARGQCVNQPDLGCREFAADFNLVDTSAVSPEPVPETRDLGWMLYDLH